MSLDLRKRLELRDEQIVDSHLPIVDAHHHLVSSPAVRYRAEEYVADARLGHNIVATVYVEILSVRETHGLHGVAAEDEVRYVLAQRARAAEVDPSLDLAASIVGHGDLTQGARLGESLDRCLEVSPDRFRGIRQTTIDAPSPKIWERIGAAPLPSGIMQHPKFEEGLREVATRGLSYDASVFDHQLPDLAGVADRHPNLLIVLDHLGLALSVLGVADRRDAFERWRGNLEIIAQHPNVVCKVSGFGLPFWGFGFERRPDAISGAELGETWRPYVETALELFGVDRCMAASNFHADGRSSGFVPTWNGLKLAARALSEHEKVTFFRDTAARTYRIDVNRHREMAETASTDEAGQGWISS